MQSPLNLNPTNKPPQSPIVLGPSSTPFTNYQAGFSIPKDPKNISSFSSANYYQSSNPFSNSINPPQQPVSNKMGMSPFGTPSFTFAGGAGNIFGSTNPPPGGQRLWKQPKLPGPIKSQNSKLDNKHKVKTVAALDEYRKYSQVEMRCFTYLQDRGLLQQFLQNGYSSLSKDYSFLKQSTNTFNNQQINQPLGQGQVQGQGQGIFAQGNQGQGIFSQSNTNNPFNQNFSPFNQGTTINNQQQPHPMVLEQMHTAMTSHMANILSGQHFMPFMQSFLQSFGITPDVMEYLIRMGLSPQQIKDFMLRWFFLKQLQQQRSKRFNFLSRYYTRDNHAQNTQVENYQHDEGYLQPLFFPHHARYPNNTNKFSKFVDYVMENMKYTWQQQVLHSAWRNHLKSNVVSDPVKGRVVRQLMDELQEIEEIRSIEAEREKRKTRVRDLQQRVGPSIVVEGNRMEMENEYAQRAGSRQIPLRVRPYYLQ